MGFKVDLDKNSQLFYRDFKTVCVEIRMSTKQKVIWVQIELRLHKIKKKKEKKKKKKKKKKGLKKKKKKVFF